MISVVENIVCSVDGVSLCGLWVPVVSIYLRVETEQPLSYFEASILYSESRLEVTLSCTYSP